MNRLALRSLLALSLAACSSTEAPTTDAAADDGSVSPDAATPAVDAAPPGNDAGNGTITIGPTDRRARLVAPGTVTEPAPLLVLLHGYGATAAAEDLYLGVTRAAATRGLYVLLPDGLTNPMGKRFWEGTPGCCNFYSDPVDDVAYLRDLVHEAIATRPIDPTRIYFFGHSNGGFMTYRVACELASETAAVAVLAGSDYPSDTDCVPSQPVSLLHVHGTADPTIPYAGGTVGLAPFPGAEEVVARWAARAGCDSTPTMDAAIDMESSLAGAETTPRTYTGCDAGLDVRLLPITGGVHIPNFAAGVIGTEVLDWLLDHHLGT